TMFIVLALAAVPFTYDGALRPGQSLTIRDINGEVRVRAGDRLSIRAYLDARGALSAKTVIGSIAVALPHGTGYELSAKTLTGGINADGIDVQRPRYGPGARANGTLGDGARKL